MLATDGKLLDNWIRKGDAESFRTLTERYAGMVYSSGLRILADAGAAEDVTQDCFEKLARLDKGPHSSLGAWLHRMATHRAIDVLRAQKRRKSREQRYSEERPAAAELSWDDVYESVDRSIDELPDSIRRAIIGHFLEGRSHAEVARSEGVSRAAITQRISRGLESMRKSLSRKGIPIASAALSALLETHLAEAAIIPTSLKVSLGKMALSNYRRGATAAGTAHWLGVRGAMIGVISLSILSLISIWFWDDFFAPSRTQQLTIESVQVQSSNTTAPTPDAEGAGIETEATPAPLEEPPATIAAEASPEPLAKEPGIYGRVYDTTTGAGIPGAIVLALFREDGDRKEVKAITDDIGIFEFLGLDPNEYRLVCWDAMGYLNFTLLTGEETEKAMKFVTLAEDQRVDSVDFALRKGIPVSGQAVDASGAPVAHARVMAITESVEMQPMETEADGQGHFIFEGLPPTSQLMIWAESDGLVSKAHGPLVAAKGGLHDVSITLEAEARIAGWVVNQAGTAISGFEIAPQGTPNDWFTAQKAENSDDGSFEVTGLAPGRYGMRLIPKGEHRIVNQPIPYVDVGPGQAISDLVLVYDGGSGVISGRVVDERGHAIEGVDVSCNQTSARTDSQGRFDLTGLGDGMQRLTAQHRSYTRQQLEQVPVGTRDLLITLPGLGSITGNVIDAETGEPVTQFEITAANGDVTLLLDQHYEDQSSAEGSFLLENVPVGPAFVAVRADGYGPLLTEVEVGATDAVVSGVVVSLRRKAALNGHVRDEAGDPVAGALLFMEGIPDQTEYLEKRSVARTRGDGSFTVVASKITRDALGVFHPDFARTGLQLSEEQLAGAPIEVTLQEGAALEVIVTHESYARPLVVIVDQIREQRPELASDGVYRTNHVPAGTVTVTATLNPDAGSITDELIPHSRRVTVEVASGETLEVEIDFAGTMGSVSGTIIDEAFPKSLYNILMDVVTEFGSDQWLAENQSDSFYFENVPVGRARIRVWRRSGPRDKVDLEFDVPGEFATTQDITFSETP